MIHGQGRAASRRVGRIVLQLVIGVVSVAGLRTERAHAGGFEAPGIGTEAMGRGGAFTAKADDGSALEYNIAGFARQRGTRLLLDLKLVINTYSFQRAGSYPVENDAGGNPLPWSGQAYPGVSSSGLGAVPVLAISTDFGYFDRWTFAIGLTTPSASDASRAFPTTVNGNWPAPQRYDVTHVNLLVVYPMLAAAVRVTKWLDIGLALQMVYGHFDLEATAFADLGSACAGPQSSGCDSVLGIKTSGFAATGALGLMFHPLEQLHIGLHVRGPMGINSSGGLTATPPAVLPAPLDPGTPENPAKATLPFHLPWVVRVGLRYAVMRNGREAGDIEIDGTYEAWKQAQGTGDTLETPLLGFFTDIKAQLLHHYKDTGSVRIGGAWNVYFNNDSRLTLRAGWFYDSSATETAYTRVDFDTLAKVGVALGLGYKIRGVTINAGYTFITSPGRIVTEGRQQVINGINGSTQASNGDPNPVFNNGEYKSTTHLLMLGLNFAFDELMRKKRRPDPFGDVAPTPVKEDTQVRRTTTERTVTKTQVAPKKVEKDQPPVEQDVVLKLKPNMFPPLDVDAWVCEPKSWLESGELRMHCTAPAGSTGLINSLRAAPEVLSADPAK